MFFAPLFLALASDLTPPPAGSFVEGPARPNAYVALNKGRMTLITDRGLESVSKLVGDAPLEHRGHLTVSAMGEVELRWMSRGSLKVMGAASVEWSGSPFDGLPLGLFDFTRAEVEVRTGELGVRLPGGVLLVADRAALELVQRSSGVFGVHHLGGKSARLVIPAHGAPDVRTLETGQWIWIDPADYLGRSRFEYVLGESAESKAATGMVEVVVPEQAVPLVEMSADLAEKNAAATNALESTPEPQVNPTQPNAPVETTPTAAEEPQVEPPTTVWVSTPIGMVEVEAPAIAEAPAIEPPAIEAPAIAEPPKAPLAEQAPETTVSAPLPSSNESAPLVDELALTLQPEPVEAPATQPKWTPWMPDLDWVPTPSALELQGLVKPEPQAALTQQVSAKDSSEASDAPQADNQVQAQDESASAAPLAVESVEATPQDVDLEADEPQAPEAQPLEVDTAAATTSTPALELTNDSLEAALAPALETTVLIDTQLEQANQRLSTRWLEDVSSRWHRPSAPISRHPVAFFEWPADYLCAPFVREPIPLPNDVLPSDPLPAQEPKPTQKPALQPKTYEQPKLIKQPSLSDLLNGRVDVE